MSRRVIAFFASLLLINSACGSRTEASLQGQILTKDSLISLFNVNGCSRQEFADCLLKINESAPKLTVIHAIIEASEDPQDDSLLAKAIRDLDNVILAKSIDPFNYSIVRSANLFNDNLNNEGILSYILDNDSVTSHYIPLFENHERQAVALPNKIVINHRPEILDGMKWFRVNEPVRIVYTKTMENFHVMDKNTLSTDLVKDKIVIVGWLGPGDGDDAYIRVGNNKMKSYSSVVTANIVLSILAEDKKNPRIINMD